MERINITKRVYKFQFIVIWVLGQYLKTMVGCYVYFYKNLILKPFFIFTEFGKPYSGNNVEDKDPNKPETFD